MRSTLVSLVLIGLLFTIPTSVTAAEQEPDVLIQNQIDRLMDILNNGKFQSPNDRRQLKRELIDEFEGLFVFREMTQRALGARARSLSEDQVDKLSEVFEELLKEIYASRLMANISGDSAGIESINIRDTEKRGPYARVRSTATFRKGEETEDFQINYKMVDRGNGWHIYDVEIEGVSLISNYRSQFSNVLSNQSIDYLIDQLRKKIDQHEISEEADGDTLPINIETNKTSGSP